ncbi:MAG TPA: alpha/beta fold hydrolase [Actinomycetota bacterium]|nr:alpha/beta fold hydrolase [Actinomycetota bacterium]
MRGPIRARGVAVLAVAATLVACGSEPAPSPGSDAITFPSEDGVALAGRLFGSGESHAGVVLAHMYPADQRSWFTFAERLASRGYRVLTFDFRGYCPGGEGGCSEGERRPAETWRDVLGAIEALRDEGGVTEIALIGASMGGTASLVAASREGVEVGAVITLSAPVSFEGLEATPDVLSRVSAAKLFVAGHEDVGAAEAVTALYEQSVQPKRPVILTTGDHGTDILSGNQGANASNEILAWLERYVPAG